MDPGVRAVGEEGQLLPLAERASGQYQRDDRGGSQAEGAGPTEERPLPYAHGPQGTAGANAKGDQDVHGAEEEGDDQPGEEKQRLQTDPREIDPLDPKSVEPLDGTEEADDGGGQEDDQQGSADERQADPEAARGPRDLDLAEAPERWLVERVERASGIAAGHMRSRSLPGSPSELSRAPAPAPIGRAFPVGASPGPRRSGPTLLPARES